MKLLANPFFGTQKLPEIPSDIPFPSVDADAPLKLLVNCPNHAATPLADKPYLAQDIGVARVHVKDETGRMGLGSFKALGAAYVIACEAVATGADNLATALADRTFVTASAGNHGLSVAVGSALFGAQAVIYLSETVPTAFARRLERVGAKVCVEGADYDASMKAAQSFADKGEHTLLSDSSWEGYFELPHRLMEGYLVSAKEAVDELAEPPTHVFLQAGVGGLAGAMAAYFRHAWGDSPVITVVEPEAAPALQASIEAGRAVYADGPVSAMGRLDCKEPSLIALKGLARDANFFLTVSEDAARKGVHLLHRHGIESTPSGVAGLAGAVAGKQFAELGLDASSRILCIISEGAEA